MAKHYPLHPGQIHAEPYYCTIPLEEYESMKKRIAQLEKDNAALEIANKNLAESVAKLNEMKSKEYELDMRERELKELKERHRWHKVSEEMLEDGAEVLASDGEEIWLCHKDTMCDGSTWFQPEGLPHIEGITHWMPLPEKPKDDKFKEVK